MKKKVPSTVIKRLPRYFRYLNEMYKNNVQKVSSRELSAKMGLTASQVRQDFNNFGGFGQQGYGYNVSYLHNEIAQILGVNQKYTAVIIGVGNLGHAIANNVNFAKRGIKLMGLFDSSPVKIGKMCVSLEITDIENIESFCQKQCPDIAILTLPKSETSKMYERLRKLGIKGFWNFSNTELKGGPDTIIENVHIGDSLMVLTYNLKESDELEN